MRLSEAQQVFTRNVAILIQYAYANGYAITFGEAWRAPEMARLYAQQGRGTATSLHIDRLAVDLNLFRDGMFLSRSDDHAHLGAYWKTLHPLNRWGGDFRRPDGNHYSMEWGGRQ